MLHQVDITKIKEKIKNGSPQEQQYLITELIAELAVVINDRTKLESECASLKITCCELRQNLMDYETKMKEEKCYLMKNMKWSQKEIHEKEMNLIKKDASYLEEQNKCLKEVNNLKLAYHKQNELFEKREARLLSKIKLLKAKSQNTLEDYKTAREVADTFMNKYTKYKTRVKHAVNVVKDLTESLEKYQEKPEMFNVECQTAFISQENFFSRCIIPSQCDFNNENIVLTDLFFKENPYNGELETLFFAPKNVYNNCNI